MCQRNRPIIRKNPVAIIPVTATASPGHKCHSLMSATHDFFAIFGSSFYSRGALENEEYERD